MTRRDYLEAAYRTNSDWPVAKVSEVLYLYVERLDLSQAEITRMTGVPRPTWHTWVRRSGVQMRGSNVKALPPHDEIDAVADYYSGDRTIRGTAAHFGRTANWVRRRLHMAGVEMTSRNETLSIGNANLLDFDDGCVTAKQAADMIGSIQRRGLILRCVRGEVPGAYKAALNADSTYETWRIPMDYIRDQQGGMSYVEKTRETVDAAPFAEWLATRIEGLDVVAMRAGMRDGSRLRAIKRGEYQSVELGTVDRILQANDARLDDVYPLEVAA